MKASVFLVILVAIVLLASGCTQSSDSGTVVLERTAKIPAGAQKMTPLLDSSPPVLHSGAYENPVPLTSVINSAGLEDSPFFVPGTSELYFFFTPDANIPPEKQVLDGVTGIYVTNKVQEGWTAPRRVMLQSPGKLALDGCAFVQDDTIWFCSAREGYTGLHWFTAHRSGGIWKDWSPVEFDPAYEVGELHIRGSELYYHSARTGTKGSTDIWVMKKSGNRWSDPVNVEAVNTEAAESLPFISTGGDELWFTRGYLGTPAIFRSTKDAHGWQEPELIVSMFAGEPTVDEAGNLYFVHHYFKSGKMIESDIYIAKKKRS
jgi:hypothetical protein